jgi:hypothetical protein
MIKTPFGLAEGREEAEDQVSDPIEREWRERLTLGLRTGQSGAL